MCRFDGRPEERRTHHHSQTRFCLIPTRMKQFVAEQTVKEEYVLKVCPISGWPLKFLSRLDRDGARGLVADLMVAGPLRRQAAFVVADCLNPDDTAAFLERLDITEVGAKGVGVALGRRRTKDIVAATFGVAPSEVPVGFLRALARIEEFGSIGPGLDPFKEPGTYSVLFRIFTGERHSRKASALRYCGALRSGTIRAAESLDPLLLYPEMLKATVTPKQITAANALLGLIRSCVSTMSDEEITLTLRRSLGGTRCIETFARKVLERADRLLAPFQAAEGLRPLTTADDLREFGKRMGNCASGKVAECALGMLAIYEVRHCVGDGTEHVLAVSLTPMVDGQWAVSDIKLAKNKHPPADVLRAVLRRFQGLGALIVGPSLTGPYRSDLGELLGAYRWANTLDGCFHDLEQAEADPIAELEDALSEVA